VLGERRGELCSPFIPEPLEVQLASTQVVRAGEFFVVSFLSRFNFQFSETRPSRKL